MSGIRYDNHAWTAATNTPPGAQAPLLSLPGAIVSVITLGSILGPFVFVPIFVDFGLTEPLANPITADGQGNFGFYAAAGTYAYVIQDASGDVLGTFPFTLASGATIATLTDIVTGTNYVLQINNGQLQFTPS